MCTDSATEAVSSTGVTETLGSLAVRRGCRSPITVSVKERVAADEADAEAKSPPGSGKPAGPALA